MPNMKKVKLPDPKRKKYGNENWSIYLSSVHKYEFTNVKRAREKNVYLEAFFNSSIARLNLVFGKLTNIYRNLYLFIDYKPTAFIEDIQKMESCLVRLLMHSNNSNNASYIYDNFIRLGNNLAMFAERLLSVAESKREMSQKFVLISTLQMLHTERDLVKNIPVTMKGKKSKTEIYELLNIA